MNKGCNNNMIATKKGFFGALKSLFIKPPKTDLHIDGKEVTVELPISKKQLQKLTEEILNNIKDC